ncbi:MAG TPA: zinc-ribbon domain-containing protein [Tepidisphaeraceae bacterium]|nr:zinc-ribbon domain-containing protein [Tepidisphaeraceae bacterium]
MHRRHGFILLFGTRAIESSDGRPPVRTVCPNCNQTADIVGKSYRQWFTVFFIPVFPISGSTRFSRCTNCDATFEVGAEELSSRVAETQREQSQRTISLYNSLRNSPANSITLNELMTLYAGLGEFDQAISAAAQFPDALNNSEQCMTTLGRIYLAQNKHAEAIQWFDAALARNNLLGEAHFHKAVAHLTSTPPDYQKAIASARAARSNGFPNADALLREAEAKARG